MTPETKTWLGTQYPWIQEAAYRILTKGTIDQTDIADFVSLIKGTLKPVVHDYPAFGVGSTPAATVRLISIGNITGIDNLTSTHPLTFGNGNLTVVYGSNGSGKSGYTRILKKASGKTGATAIKPNIYKAPPPQSKCTITFSIDGKPSSCEWIANSAPIPELSAVDIFDSNSGRIYIEDETVVAFTPPELLLFSDLVDACKKVDSALFLEQSKLVSALPAIPQNILTTAAAKKYNTLKANMSGPELSILYPWKPEDEKKLAALNEKLLMTDLLSAATKKRAVKLQIESLKTKLQTALSSINPASCQRIRDLCKAAKDSRQTATEGSIALTASSKLEGISSATWRSLWNAAKDFSVTNAYPDKPFPNIEDMARCVLCHQNLDKDAKKRLIDFESYISGTLESAAQAAEVLAEGAINSLPKSPLEDELRTACQAAELPEDLLVRLNSVWLEIQAIVKTITTDPLNNTSTGITSIAHPLVTELITFSEAAEKAAIVYEKDATIFDRKKAAADVLELEGKKWTSQQSEAIINEVGRLKEIETFTKWKQAAITAGISRKAGDLSETLITQAYIDRFNDELRKLNASRISVELIMTRAEKGQAKHRIQLKGLVDKGNEPGAILSEGENRIISIAAFLADVTGKPTNTPFVFDDPISSLDQDYEGLVAARLAALAKTRQVIVFTHRLTLCGGMEDAVSKFGDPWKKEHFQKRCIEVFSCFSGHPVDESILNLDTSRATTALLDQHKKAKAACECGDSATYNMIAQSICSDFRKLLERTIECDLLSKVVLRHRRSITTDKIIGNLAKISADDCSFFDGMMTKYSCFEHSYSAEAPVKLPNESDLKKDIEDLKGWREVFKKRT